MLSVRLRNSIKDYQDFPKKNIIFKDISPILTDPELFFDLINDKSRFNSWLNSCVTNFFSSNTFFNFDWAESSFSLSFHILEFSLNEQLFIRKNVINKIINFSTLVRSWN